MELRTLLQKRRNQEGVGTHPHIVDIEGCPIHIGDWVTSITKGNFVHKHGEVISIKKWITSLNTEGVKLVHAQTNVLVRNDDRKYDQRQGDANVQPRVRKR